MHFRYRHPIWGAVLAAAAAWTTGFAAGPFSEGRLSRSDVCAECHKDIYAMWKVSAHASSMEDPVFQDAYRETVTLQGASVSALCLGCHAPAAGILKDKNLDSKVTWDGVSCDVCHVLSKVEVTGMVPVMSFSPGPVKLGPIEDATPARHEVRYSELHTTALICAGCHQFVNSEGVPIMTTYAEWSDSPSAKAGKNCQTCHMGRQKANVVDPKIMRVPESMVNLHEVPGGHSLTQLNKAISVAINPVHANGQASLDITLYNDGAGHSVPTGMPGRRVKLQFRAVTSEGQTIEEERVYGETFKDAAGRVITQDSGYFAKGVVMTADTRLKSGERRTESFRFPLGPTATADVTVKLHYEHVPTDRREDATLITFYSERRVLGPEAPRVAERGLGCRDLSRIGNTMSGPRCSSRACSSPSSSSAPFSCPRASVPMGITGREP